MTCALYRQFDASGHLLYVGISENPKARLARHKSQSSWASEIASTAVEWLPSRGHARHAEAICISEEKPRYNQKNTCQLHVRGQISELIDTWPSRKAFAEAVGQSVKCIHRWAQRDRFPSEHLAAVLAACREFGLEHVTAEWLIDACADAGKRREARQ